MKVAYSYTRFSTPEQKKGDSARRQLQAAKEWCDQNKYVLSDNRFLDEGISAFKGKHLQGEGELKRFLSLVESGKIKPGSVLILESFDRLSRLPITKAVSLFLNLLTSGIGIVFTMTCAKRLITQPVVDNEPYILYAIVGEAQRAHEESRHKSNRIKEAREQRKMRAKDDGLKVLSWCPPWCDFDKDKGYIVNQKRANVIRRIFDEYLKGNGAFRISRMFNAEKVPPLGHRGTKVYKNTTTEWYKKTVRDFLFDRRVYGYAHHLDKEGYYPAIVSKDKFNMVQNRLALRSVDTPTGGPVESVSNLFTSICRCAHCGGVMSKTLTRKTYKTKTTLYEYLVCDSARSGMGCSYKSVPYQFIEDSFLQLLDNPAFYGSMAGIGNKAADRLAILQGEMATTEKQIQKLTSKFLEMDDPPVSLMDALKQFEAKKPQLQKSIRLAEAESQTITDMPSEVMELKNELGTRMKEPEFRLRVREYIRNVVKSISLDAWGDPQNYQVTFKNGFVASMIFWKIGKEDKDGISYQVFAGVRKTYDPDAIIFGTREPDPVEPKQRRSSVKVKPLPKEFTVPTAH